MQKEVRRVNHPFERVCGFRTQAGGCLHSGSYTVAREAQEEQ